MVLNTKLNMIDMDFIAKMNQVLDEVEASEGPAVLVTVASGPTVFCSGFNLKFWAANPWNMQFSLTGMQHLFARLLTVNVPSLCVWQGHAVAGGVFIGLCHDRLIMNDDPKFMVMLNELSFGKAVPYSYNKVVKEVCGGRVARTLFLGTKISPQDAHRLGIVQDLYHTKDDLHKEIQDFAKQRAPIGKWRENYKTTKTHLTKQLLDVLWSH